MKISIIKYYIRLIKYTFNLKSDFILSLKENKILFRGNISPWFTTSFLNYLESIEVNLENVLEFGSGSSTIYWSKISKKVISIEHDPDFYFFIKDQIKAYDNVDLKLRSLDLNLYTSAIKEENYFFDLIVIDGMNREEIIQMAPSFLTERGVIILDNSHRPSYQTGIEFLLTSGFKKLPFFGLPVQSPFFSETTIFYRKNNRFNI